MFWCISVFHQAFNYEHKYFHSKLMKTVNCVLFPTAIMPLATIHVSAAPIKALRPQVGHSCVDTNRLVSWCKMKLHRVIDLWRGKFFRVLILHCCVRIKITTNLWSTYTRYVHEAKIDMFHLSRNWIIIVRRIVSRNDAVRRIAIKGLC